jgi:hypothetical protein
MQKMFKTSAVLLGIIFLAGCGKQQVSQTQPIVPIASVNQPATNQEWQVYKNEKFGFELRYPQNWKIIENKNYITFKSPDDIVLDAKNDCKKGPGPNCNMQVLALLTLTYETKQEFEKKIGKDSIEEERVAIGNVDFIKYAIFGSYVSGDNYRTEKNGNVYNFEVGGNVKEQEDPRKIMESFKFTK